MSQIPDISPNSPGGRKVFPSPEAALDGLTDGAVVLIGGFQGLGVPEALLGALLASNAGNLTCICQGAWTSSSQGQVIGLDVLAASGQMSKLIAPLPFLPGDPSRNSGGFSGGVEDRWKSGLLEIEAVPQGVLAERLRAGGAGLGGVFLPMGAGGTPEGVSKGNEVRQFGGQDHVFYTAIHADFGLLRAAAADTLGNLVYRGGHRNWNPVMAMAAAVSVAEVDEIVEIGGLDAELVISPGIFVNRVVQTI
jgi:3-oxoadipate CoA-transferase alpha subunit